MGQARRTVAIIGAGMIGEVHRRAAILAGATVVGVLASSPERSRQVADAWGVPQAYADLDAVVASDVEVVHICAPNASHVPYAIALMEAGKQVICEKPLGIGVDDARRAAAVAETTGMVNTMPFAYRFHPMARELRARVQDEAFGAVNLIHGNYLQDWLLAPMSTSWRVDPAVGGPSRAFGDIGSHWCDLAEWVTGQRIASLVATTSISIAQRPATTGKAFSADFGSGEDAEVELADVTTEDSAMILFRTTDGVAGSTVISQLSAGRKNHLWIEVDGMSQSAVFDQEQAEKLWIGTEESATVLMRDPTRFSPEQRRLAALPAGHAEGYAQCFESFVADSDAAIDARRDGGEPPDGLPTFADGLRAAQICDAMMRSAASGRWEQVED